jgi:hypothetical protein
MHLSGATWRRTLKLELHREIVVHGKVRVTGSLGIPIPRLLHSYFI